MEVNSRHHQAVKEAGAELKVAARSSDGIIEALEHTRLPIDLVQWHPELMMLGSDAMAPLFAAFVHCCKR